MCQETTEERKRQEVHEEHAVLWTDRRVLAARHLTLEAASQECRTGYGS